MAVGGPGRRNTRQRAAILGVLSSVRSHPTASEIYEMVREDVPSISMSTVYRTLCRLADDGLVKKITVPGGQARFDGRTHRHLHARCRSCGRVVDIEADVDLPIAREVERLTGFSDVVAKVEFEGTCPRCKEGAE